MSERVTVSISEEHYAWLQEVMRRRGWGNVQAAIRSLIEDQYRLEKKLGAKIVDAPVALKAEKALTEKRDIRDLGGHIESLAKTPG